MNGVGTQEATSTPDMEGNSCVREYALFLTSTHARACAPLRFWAAESGFCNTVRLLLQHRADTAHRPEPPRVAAHATTRRLNVRRGALAMSSERGASPQSDRVVVGTGHSVYAGHGVGAGTTIVADQWSAWPTGSGQSMGPALEEASAQAVA